LLTRMYSSARTFPKTPILPFCTPLIWLESTVQSCTSSMYPIIPEGSPGGEAFYNEEIEKAAEAALKEEYAKKLGDFKNVVFVVKNGSPDMEIIRYAKKNDIDVIVMGALGKAEQDRMVHGSTVANVSKYAHCHVIAIRNPAKQFTLPGSMY
jgi:nucleotide-binding universal stress UspA family protein